MILHHVFVVREHLFGLFTNQPLKHLAVALFGSLYVTTKETVQPKFMCVHISSRLKSNVKYILGDWVGSQRPTILFLAHVLLRVQV